MTCASRSEQCGQRGSERGCGRSISAFFRLANCELLLLEAAEHGERRLVNRARPAAAAHRVPGLPVDLDAGRLGLEPLLQARPQLGRPQAQAAVPMQLSSFPVGWPEPFDGLLPRLAKWLGVDAGFEPASSVEEVVSLLP